MTKGVDPSPGAITYCQWLARQVEAGGLIMCGPPVADRATLTASPRAPACFPCAGAPGDACVP